MLAAGDSIGAEASHATRTEPSLEAAARPFFPLGAGISDATPSRPQDWPLLTRHFGWVTPENCLKPAQVQPAEDAWDFSTADAFVEFAEQRHLRVVGHCLVWAKDDRTPAWFFKDGEKAASRALVLERMRKHVEKVVGRYRGRLGMWDVVNEAIDDGSGELRPSGWTAACGADFLAEAFAVAHRADPAALLIYNDYNNELAGKREKTLRVVERLVRAGVPVHAVGMQGHYEIDRVPYEDLETTMKAVRALGLKLVISELDIDVIPRGKWWADGGAHRAEMSRLDPYREGCPADILQRQAEQYARLFALFRQYADVLARVSFWNLDDGQSWLNYFPWQRVNHPLLFDRRGAIKPAFTAVLEVLQRPKP